MSTRPRSKIEPTRVVFENIDNNLNENLITVYNDSDRNWSMIENTFPEF